MLNNLKQDLKGLSSRERAKANAWFFKTGKGTLLKGLMRRKENFIWGNNNLYKY